uniref:Carbohydrate esterase family 16 protein n=1 Tax=Moniliophthora roreri TaxID=221103 RepID=A0A0W0F2T7_MONRR
MPPFHSLKKMKTQSIFKFLYTLGLLDTLHSPGLNDQERNDGIRLAVSPICGSFPGNVADINAGIDPGRVRTIVSFGDSFTDGGKDDGSPLDPPVIIPPNHKAGGRSTNGPVWVEGVADDMGNATLMDYAVCHSPRPIHRSRGQFDVAMGRMHRLVTLAE